MRDMHVIFMNYNIIIQNSTCQGAGGEGTSSENGELRPSSSSSSNLFLLQRNEFGALVGICERRSLKKKQ